jgi:hypothetical protein
MDKPVWFWVNAEGRGKPLSPRFETEDDAESWYEETVNIYKETERVLKRTATGKIHTLIWTIDFTKYLSAPKKHCPFETFLLADGQTIEGKILGEDVQDARNRVLEYFDVIDWLE